MKALLVLFLLLNLNSLVAQITITKTYYDQNLTQTSLEKDYAYLRVEYRDIKNNKRWVDTLFELNTLKKAISYYTIDTNQNVFKQVFRYEDNVLTDIENYKNNKKEGVFKKIKDGESQILKYHSDSLVYKEFNIKKETTKMPVVEVPKMPIRTSPTFKGGKDSLALFIEENTIYPEKALKNKISCEVMLKFIVEEDGRVSNVEALKCSDESLKAEAIRVIKLTSYLWIPATEDNLPVRFRTNIPIFFNIEE